MESIRIFTDGACHVSTGIGAWAYLIRGSDGREQSDAQCVLDTTNNRMELTALLEALKVLSIPYEIEVVSDSRYVVDGSKWVHGWARNNWRGGTIKNIDLWRRFLNLSSQHDMKFTWVRGHDGHPENELVDRLAVEAAKNV